jgi:hypothetical protein
VSRDRGVDICPKVGITVIGSCRRYRNTLRDGASRCSRGAQNAINMLVLDHYLDSRPGFFQCYGEIKDNFLFLRANLHHTVGDTTCCLT